MRLAGGMEISKGGKIGSLAGVLLELFIAVSFSDYILYRDWTVGFKYLFCYEMYLGTLWRKGNEGNGIGMIIDRNGRKTSKTVAVKMNVGNSSNH